MTMLASQITSLPVVCSIVYSDVNQRKHQSSASLAFVREIHRGPVNFPHKWPVTRKMFPFDDVIMLIVYNLPYVIFDIDSSQSVAKLKCCIQLFFDKHVFKSVNQIQVFACTCWKMLSFICWRRRHNDLRPPDRGSKLLGVMRSVIRKVLHMFLFALFFSKRYQFHILPVVPLPVKLMYYGGLIHLHLGKMAAISQKTFLNAFAWLKMFEFRQ